MVIKLNHLFILLTIAFIASCRSGNQESGSGDKTEISINVKNRYLNLPVSQAAGLAKMTFAADSRQEKEFVIRLAPGKPDYWVFYDISKFSGKDLVISYAGNSEGLVNIYQA